MRTGALSIAAQVQGRVENCRSVANQRGRRFMKIMTCEQLGGVSEQKLLAAFLVRNGRSCGQASNDKHSAVAKARAEMRREPPALSGGLHS